MGLRIQIVVFSPGKQAPAAGVSLQTSLRLL